MRGRGGRGKTSTLRSMCDMPFIADHASTAGAATTTLEISRADLELARDGKLAKYKPGFAEHVLAVANAAAAHLKEDAAAAAAGPSMIDEASQAAATAQAAKVADMARAADKAAADKAAVADKAAAAAKDWAGKLDTEVDEVKKSSPIKLW